MEDQSFTFSYQLPQHKPPVFKEAKMGDIISYGDKSNPYPDYLIDLYHGSVKHNSIINGITRFVTGGGWSIQFPSFGNELNTADKAKAQQIIYKANPDQDLKDLSADAQRAIDIFGGVAHHIIRTKDGENIAEVYVLNWANLRAVQVDIKGEKSVYKWIYLPSWKGVSKYEQAKTKPGFREFDEWTGAEGQKEGIYIWRMPRIVKSGELDLYPLPEYIGSIPYIEADKEVANFDVNNVKNQFWGGQIVTMRNVFKSVEQKDEFVSDFKSRKQGTDNAGEVLFVFPNGNDTEVTATPLQPSDIDKNMDVLNQRIEKNIFLAHNFNKKLFGIDEQGNPFSKSELQDIYEISYSQNIRPKQEILEEIYNWIYSFNSIKFELKLNKLPLIDLGENDEKGKVLESLNSLSPAIQQKVLDSMSKDQILSLIGLKSMAIQRTEVVTETQMKEQEDKIASYFDNSGSTDYDVIKSFTFEGVPQGDSGFKAEYFAEVLGVDIDSLKADILSAISRNKKMTAIDIADAFDLEVTEAQEILKELLDAGILKGKEGNLEISKRGKGDISDEDVVLDIEVRYRYAGPSDNRNRSFCRKMLSMTAAGKTWSRAEIDNLSNDQNYNTNAWVYRGGFYTKKGTDDTTPYCRHHWESVIVTKKKV